MTLFQVQYFFGNLCIYTSLWSCNNFNATVSLAWCVQKPVVAHWINMTLLCTLLVCLKGGAVR